MVKEGHCGYIDRLVEEKDTNYFAEFFLHLRNSAYVIDRWKSEHIQKQI